ncbi:hypothetical protein G5V57_27505 [Nordella sp. HKS 07]|uniref:hypothetical protein n=1 Tax=Nordella sp. HKS 07 TaxID=2712222 RepID=UPI0013E173A3|nr:hypothetical protein [Nordella sp. HKS 07]QIG51139.1 hypothetical protein G5V57_27505 [Nordella sp. HKS 07]
MRDAQSFDRKGGGTAKTSRLSNLNLGISAFAALAGVVFAGIQAFSPTSEKTPINVTVALDPAKKVGQVDPAIGIDVAKSGGVIDAVNSGGKSDITAATLPQAAAQTAALDLSRNIATAALKDGSEARYQFRDLFDGSPETELVIQAPDQEVNVLLDLGGERQVSALEYAPPTQADGMAKATILDVMVLPEGKLEASGRPVMSYPLQTSAGRQTFSLPAQTRGKYLWLRIAGPAGAEKVAVGEFKVLQ